jgi:hypothetical protein
MATLALALTVGASAACESSQALRAMPRASVVLATSWIRPSALTRVDGLEVGLLPGRAESAPSGPWIASCDVVVANRSDGPRSVGPDAFFAASPFVPEPSRSTLRSITLHPGEQLRARLAWRAPAASETPKRLRIGVRLADAHPMIWSTEIRLSSEGERGALGAGWLPTRDAMQEQTHHAAPSLRYSGGVNVMGMYGERIVRMNVQLANRSNAPLSIHRFEFDALIEGERAHPLGDVPKDPRRLYTRLSSYCPAAPLAETLTLQPGETVTRSLCFETTLDRPAREAVVAFATDPHFPSFESVALDRGY